MENGLGRSSLGARIRKLKIDLVGLSNVPFLENHGHKRRVGVGPVDLPSNDGVAGSVDKSSAICDESDLPAIRLNVAVPVAGADEGKHRGRYRLRRRALHITRDSGEAAAVS